MMRFKEDFIGHEQLIASLERALERGETGHAYLFIGPSGTGKKTVARALAGALLTGRLQGHPDFLEVPRVNNTVPIAEIRALQDWMAYKPFLGSRRAVIIPQAHLMSAEAANALLKTLEDPEGHVTLILTADDDSLPATVVSRCQVLKFSALSGDEVENILLKRGVPADQAGLLALISEGSPGRALALAGGNPAELVESGTELLRNLAEGNRLAALEAAEKLESDRERTAAILTVMTILVRDALLWLREARGAVMLLAPDLAGALTRAGADSLTAMMRLLLQARRGLNSNANQLLLQVNLYFRIADYLEGVV